MRRLARERRPPSTPAGMSRSAAGRPVTRSVRTGRGCLGRAPVCLALQPEDVRPVAWSPGDQGARPRYRALARPSGRSDTVVAVLQNGIDHEARVRSDSPGPWCRSWSRSGPSAWRRVTCGTRAEAPCGCRPANRANALRRSGRSARSVRGWNRTATPQSELLGNIGATPVTALTLRRMEVLSDPEVVDLARALVAPKGWRSAARSAPAWGRRRTSWRCCGRSRAGGRAAGCRYVDAL